MNPVTLPPDWPHRNFSRHIACKPHLWHVQIMGQGPDVLLLHGAGGSTHSWNHLMPILAQSYRVIAIDLPGQGFTRLGSRMRCGLDPMAVDLDSLSQQQNWQPVAYIGHSAGAALALRLAEIRLTKAVVGINAALGNFDGVAGVVYPAMAKLLALTPLVPQIFSKLSGTKARVQSLLTSTGSQIDAAGLAQYLTLLKSAGHVDATLAMMSQWNLNGLLTRLPQLETPCLLITAAKDTAVPPVVSQTAAAQMPHGTCIDVGDYGHLVHEENAQLVANAIQPFLTKYCAT